MRQEIILQNETFLKKKKYYCFQSVFLNLLCFVIYIFYMFLCICIFCSCYLHLRGLHEQGKVKEAKLKWAERDKNVFFAELCKPIHMNI